MTNEFDPSHYWHEWFDDSPETDRARGEFLDALKSQLDNTPPDVVPPPPLTANDLYELNRLAGLNTNVVVVQPGEVPPDVDGTPNAVGPQRVTVEGLAQPVVSLMDCARAGVHPDQIPNLRVIATRPEDSGE
ncbi:hypothetical protein GO011_14650 [Mycobacterium sp. 20091114027_K0903767]|nr:hypothetical protein [Mycobacterium sp. 20091114027_K0903767]